MILALLLSILLGVFGYLYYGFYYYYYSYLKKIPSASLWPVMNNVVKHRSRNSLIDIIEQNMKKLNTKSLRIQLPTRAFVITQDYKVVEQILSSSVLIDKGFEYQFFANWGGINILNASGIDWRSKRKMLTPTFHFQILDSFQDSFNTNSAIMISKLRKCVGEKSVDIFPFVTNCSLDIICETAMGASNNAQSSETKSPYCAAVFKMFQIIPIRVMNILYHSDILFRMSGLYKKEQGLLKVIHEYQDKIIRARRQKFIESQKDGSSDTDIDTLGRKKKIPFLDLLFQTTIDGKPLSDEEISNEVSTFMVAGHDSTSNAISFALYLLANHPEVQEKAFDELKHIFGNDKERPATVIDLQSMNYMELVIKETLRLYPPAPIFSRRITEDFTVDGITYPAGLSINIFAYGMHRDENYFQNASTFDPDRFSNKRYDGRNPYSYIPFSAGPRNCIGQKYAMQELKTVLSAVLRNYSLKPASPQHIPQVSTAILIRSNNGINISFVERK